MNNSKLIYKNAVYVISTDTDLPVETIDAVYHIGDFNPKSKGTESYEGGGLSVSQHPEEWAAIARLPGDTWLLTNPSGSFLGALSLAQPKKKKIQKWGIRTGYLKTSTLWRMYYYDEDMEEERYFEFADQEDAEAEFEGYAEDDQDVRIEEMPGSFIGTRKLATEGRNKDVIHSEGIAWDILLTLYVEHETNLDGVWWHERLDVLNLSAPRGVIVPSKLSRWSVEKLDSSK